MHKLVVMLVLFVFPPDAKSLQPGTFFWKPRLALYLGKPTEPPPVTYPPNDANIKSGVVVMIDGYRVGTTVLSVVAGYYAVSTKPFVHLRPLTAHYQTNVYRWALRHLSLIPKWLGTGGSYTDTHKVWRQRYRYMDDFMPKWMRTFFPWVPNSEWEKEEDEYKLFLRYAEPAFGRHNVYPGKVFNDYGSIKTGETLELLV